MKPEITSAMSVAIVGVALVVMVLLFLAGLWGLGASACYLQWGDAYQTRYGLGGCKLLVDGKWLPEKAYGVREVGQ